MRFFVRILTVLLVCPGASLIAQSAGSAVAGVDMTHHVVIQPVVTQPVVSFKFERVGMPVPRFTLQVREDGTGSYQADVTAGVSSDASMATEAGKHVYQIIKLTPAMVEKIFKVERELKHFNIACASKAKNIADTGTKTLSYVGPDGRGSCVYNYSENKNVAMLTDTFLGVAFTLDEGRRLEFLHRYDRLGLDAEMSVLSREAEAGRALELGTIAPTLTAIAGDMALMQRVRLRAAKMLEQANEK